MSEKPESDDFDGDDDDDDVTSDGGDELNVDRAIKDLDLAKKRGTKLGACAKKSTRRN